MHADDKELLLKEIFEDFSQSKDLVNQVLQEIEDNAISNYPILVLSKEEINLGLKIVDKEDFNLRWNFNISHLEEFVAKGIVLEEKAKEFIAVYKEHSAHYCLFIMLSETEADFAYVQKNQV